MNMIFLDRPAEAVKRFIEQAPLLLHDLEFQSGSPRTDWYDYAVTIHGVKLACESVCANKLRQLAEDLEKAALRNDAAYIAAYTPVLVKDGERLARLLAELLEDSQPSMPVRMWPKKVYQRTGVAV
jgi:HPt (histidine-containing phosphotransfer) domain-containing protein